MNYTDENITIVTEKEFDMVTFLWTISFVTSLAFVWGYMAYNVVLDINTNTDMRYLLLTPFLALISSYAVFDLVKLVKLLREEKDSFESVPEMEVAG